MKHGMKITLLLLIFFMISQFFGLFVISYDMQKIVDTTTNTTITTLSETAIGERPQIEGVETIIFLSTAILFGTLIILILARFRKKNLWKLWYFIAIFMTISITLGVFVKNPIIYIFALIIALLKIYKPNFYIHNFSEILVYSGIAFLIVPLLNVLYASVLLFIISLYDAFAVWQSKHMIKLAVFQRDSNVFAGLHMKYDRNKEQEKIQENKKEIKPIKTNKYTHMKKSSSKTRTTSAVLGGGDIAFPLVFAGVFLTYLFSEGYSKTVSYILTTPIVLTTTISLALLLMYGKKDKFYPAMPFISAGCFLGLGISYILTLI
ncbi:hypothetical protein C0585_05370 [Candidatus Woesearchaeota archaeon]|nr:MAG: hypothetical protein C0585_05370 [Candidatus Woesearchaeota archaeon]